MLRKKTLLSNSVPVKMYAACHRVAFSECVGCCHPAEVPSSVFGDKLREQVEERLSFYETGNLPRKNVDVMKEAVKEVSTIICL